VARKVETTTKGLVKRVRSLMDSKHAIDQGVLLTELMDVIGGPRALAQVMWLEYQNAPQGGLARQKFLQMVQHLTISTTSSNLTRIIKPENLSDEDLEDMIDERMKRISDGRLIPSAAADSPEGAAQEPST
jgi:hypothetical protein